MKKRYSVEIWVLPPEEYDENHEFTGGGINDCFTTHKRTAETALKAICDSIKRSPDELAGAIVKVVVFEERYEVVKVPAWTSDEPAEDIQERMSVAVEYIDLTSAGL